VFSAALHHTVTADGPHEGLLDSEEIRTNQYGKSFEATAELTQFMLVTDRAELLEDGGRIRGWCLSGRS